MGEAGAGSVDAPPRGHPATAPGPDTDEPPGGRHPNEPRESGKDLIVKWMTSPDGPQLVWRENKSAYSARDQREYTVYEFRKCYDETILQIMLDRSKEISQHEVDSNFWKYRKLLKLAREVWNLWIDAAFTIVFNSLPQKGRKAAVTDTEEAGLHELIKLALTKQISIPEGQGNIGTRMSVMDWVYHEGSQPMQWTNVGRLQVWYRKGPQIAIQSHLLLTTVPGRFAKWKSKRLAEALKDAGIIEYTRIRGNYVWQIKDGWLEEHLDVHKVADDDLGPQPALFDTKRAAAGDKENDDDPVPF